MGHAQQHAVSQCSAREEARHMQRLWHKVGGLVQQFGHAQQGHDPHACAESSSVSPAPSPVSTIQCGPSSVHIVAKPAHLSASSAAPARRAAAAARR
eukprot:6850464-Prymnesium_polylepis.1